MSTPAYAVVPDSGTGPGVLVLHSWFGLTRAVRATCDRLADAGFCALAPDLLGDTTTDPSEGRALLAEADPNELSVAVRATARALQRMPATPGDAPIGVVGWSMGGSLGLWLSERQPDDVAAVVSYYGTQGIDFVRTSSAYLCHLAESDEVVDVDELALMEASLHLAEASLAVHTYEGTHHSFAEPHAPAFDPAASELAWDRTIAFLDCHLG